MVACKIRLNSFYYSDNSTDSKKLQQYLKMFQVSQYIVSIGAWKSRHNSPPNNPSGYNAFSVQFNQ